MSRITGVVLIIVGIVLCLVASAWLFTNPDLTGSARILGFGLALLVLVGPFVVGGIYVLSRGVGDAQQAKVAAQQRKLLNLVQAKGEAKMDELALDLQVPRDQIREIVLSLVGLGVFNGYIAWDKGTLYSSDASKLRDLKACPNCGGEITLSGKGVARCRFCGTEFFLS